MTTSLGFRPQKAGEKDQRWRNLEVYSQHPSHQCHLESATESSGASQVVEATGESHGYRECEVTWWVGHPLPERPCPLELKVLGIPGAGQGRWRGRELGELKARVHADGIAQLFPEGALLAVVGQLEQVEAGGGGGQAATRLPLADGEEAPEDTAKGVPCVLIV